MTVKQFAEKHYGEVNKIVLCEAGIRCIRSYRAIFSETPEKISEGLYHVYNYPEKFHERMKIIFNRLQKEKLIAKVVKKQPKPLYSAKPNG